MSYTSKYTGAEIDARLDKMPNVTWQELKDLRDAGNLIAGQMYRMTDYETMTSQAGTQSAGHPFDLVLTALDNKTLSEECSAIQSARDTDGYFANSNLSAWRVWYCLDNDIERFDWAVKPGKSISVDLSAFGLGNITATLNGTFVYNDTTYAKWITSVQGLETYILTPSEDVTIGSTPMVYIIAEGGAVEAGTITSVTINENEGKGVVYRLIDEKENDIPYDFKNIQFVRKITDGALDLENGTDTYCYTFSDFSTGTLLDASESLSDTICNKFGVQCWNNVFLGNKRHSNTDDEGHHSNTFGDRCHSNTFGENCNFNDFGDRCHSNTFGADFHCNTLGDNCYYNTFGGFAHSNTFGDECYSNTFGYGYHYNTLGISCNRSTFGKSCRYNTFGNGCNDNTFGEDCQYNSFGNDCYDNSFGNDCQYNTFGYHCKYITLNDATSCIHILNNISGTSSTPLTPDVATNKTYVQTVAYNSSGVLKVYCEADLVS